MEREEEAGQSLNVNFQCPKCDHGIEADVSMVGDLVDCPSCQTPIQVPGKTLAVSHPLLSDPSRVIIVGAEIPFGQIFAITFKVLICMFLIVLVIFLVAFACGFLSSALFRAMM